MSLLKRPVEQIGKKVIDAVQGLGSITNFITSFFYWGWRRPLRFRSILAQLYFIGNKSIFIVILSGVFTGAVMAYQTYFGFKLINVDSLVGTITALALAKELGPVLTGLIVAGRAGAAMAAQIGTMKVTEQVDALEVMGINAHKYLAVPRIIAGCIALPMLSVIFILVGNIGSWFVGTKALFIDDVIYFSKLSQFMHVEDIAQGVIKGFAFGFILSVFGTYFGFQAQKGAEDVGRGTNLAVVWGMITILVADYFLTSFLVRIL